MTFLPVSTIRIGQVTARRSYAALVGAALIATVSLLAVSGPVFGADLVQRIIEGSPAAAVIWGMPAVNYQLMLEQGAVLGAKPNQIVYWSGLPDWRTRRLPPIPTRSI